MTSIVLIRHGATAWSGSRYLGRTDLPLTAAGRESARITAEQVAATTPVDVRIVSSPSLRARETAATVAEAIGRRTVVAVEPDARWAEVDVGDVEGLTFEEAEERFPTLARQLAAAEIEIDGPGGETAASFRARITAAWADVVSAGRPTIVVSHAGSIRVAMALATGRPEAGIAFLAPAEAVHLEVDD
jgi:broad specificity phosphatase PhoE